MNTTTNTTFNTATQPATNPIGNTIKIDARMKELYYYKQDTVKVSKNESIRQFQFWNYMASMSVQNMTYHCKNSSLV